MRSNTRTSLHFGERNSVQNEIGEGQNRQNFSPEPILSIDFVVGNLLLQNVRFVQPPYRIVEVVILKFFRSHRHQSRRKLKACSDSTLFCNLYMYLW